MKDAKAIFPREQYLSQLRPFYHKTDLIKVVSGIRRCGKSCLMQSVIQELREAGVREDMIINLNLDSRQFRHVTAADQLDRLIEERVGPHGVHYVFVDEVQNVADFEPVLNGWREDGRTSIFVTGSNSYLLSGELVTKLTGRHIEFPMYPLNFQEYVQMRSFLQTPDEDLNRMFTEYIRQGGFPESLSIADTSSRDRYVRSVVEQIFEKDVRGRQKIRDRDAFDRITTFVINNFGAPTTKSGLVDRLRMNAGIHTTRKTVDRYLQILENARILEPCRRFDLKSKRSLGAADKYYLADLGIYFSRNTDGRINYGPALENILYIYLRSKGYTLSVGKVGNLECDFIARKGNSYAYVQVAMTISDPDTEGREYRVFRNIKEGYPRFLFTLDPLLQEREGVTHLNLRDFMAAGGELIRQSVC